MKHTALVLALLSSALATGCAGNPATHPGAPAVATTAQGGLTAEDRVAFFVNHARSGEVAELRENLAQGQPVDAVDPLGQTALIAASSSNSLEAVRVLLEHGADANIPDNAGWTPLIHAAYFGASPELLAALIDGGAKIDAANHRGVTALYLASATGHEQQVKLLVQRGADASVASQAGYTPLRIAKLRGLGAIVSLLDGAAARAN